MKNNSLINIAETKKRKYDRPEITTVKIDNDISIFMASPGSDPPETSIRPDHFSINPFKLPNL